LAGAAGGIHAVFVSYVTTNGTFNITVPLTVVLMSVLGGTRHWAGPLIGAAAITILLYASTAADQAVVGKAVTGAILVAAVLFMPGGILGRWRMRSAGAGTGARMPGVPVAVARNVALRAAARDASPAPVAVPHHAAAAVAPGVADGGRVAATLRTTTGAAPMLAVRGLRKAFKGVRALDGIDLDIREGEIVGVIGPNGSGKSTLINVVSGHFRADAGSLAFRGHDIAAWPAHRIARAGIARTYQVPRPFAQLDVHDNVALTAMFGAAALDRRQADAAAATWLAFAGLARRARGLPGALNLHETKFLELARALAAAPRLLMLDEVLSGLTPGEIDEAVDLIRRIRDGGTTIVLVEHVVRVVTELSDRVVVLDQGRVLAQGGAAEVMARDDVALAYLGVARA
jgi:branched-chain amino acid transport system permease protein